MSIDPNRLRFLEEQLAQRRGAIGALRDRQTDAQATAAHVLRLAQAATEQLRSHGAISTLAQVVEANRLAIEQRGYPLVPPKELRAALAATEYAADLRRRIAVGEKEIIGLSRLVDACRKVATDDTPDYIPIKVQR